MKKYDIYQDGNYLETINARNEEEAYAMAESKYPYVLDDDLLEVEEVK